MNVFEAIEQDDHTALESLLAEPASITATIQQHSVLGFDRTYGPVSWSARSTSVSDADARSKTLQMLVNAGCSATTGACLLECSHRVLVTMLLGYGAPVDQSESADPQARTPLAYRLAERMFDAANLLLQNGANPNALDKQGEPLFFHALFSWAQASTPIDEVRKAVTTLKSYALDLGQSDLRGNTIVMEMIQRTYNFASAAQFYEFIDEILSHNLDLTLKNKAAENCLHLAVDNEDFRQSPFDLIVRLMSFNAYYGINDFNLKGRTPIFRLLWPASLAGPLKAEDRDLIKLFISRGASPSHQDNEGNTPLHLFADRSCVDKGAVGPNLPPAPGTPHRQVYLEILNALLTAGADRTLKNQKGQTALAIAKATGGNNCYDFASAIEHFQP